VKDEALDEFTPTKNKWVVGWNEGQPGRFGYGEIFAEWGVRDVQDMVRRDRNHPSVILWSIGNEVLEQADADGWKIARRLTDICHEEDPTRLVTAGFSQRENAIRNRLVDQVDVPGFNYQAPHYAAILEDHPRWSVLGAETSSCVSSRGVYHLPIEKYRKHPSRQLTSYDVIAPPWAYAPDVEFDAQDRLARTLGEFVWTGFDYLGEPTPYFPGDEPRDENDWPARSSYFGILDLAGRLTELRCTELRCPPASLSGDSPICSPRASRPSSWARSCPRSPRSRRAASGCRSRR